VNLSLLIACSGSDSNGKQGRFLDSAVIGVYYETESTSGFTDEEGGFNYLPGETVTFKLGDINFGSAQAMEIVTPMDLLSSNNEINEQVSNLLRFIQTIDKDGDPSNGIQITETMHRLANGTHLDFSQNQSSFEQDTQVLSYLGKASNTNLVDANTARAHFELTLASQAYQIFLQSFKEAIPTERAHGTVSLEGVDTAGVGNNWTPYYVKYYPKDPSILWLSKNGFDSILLKFQKETTNLLSIKFKRRVVKGNDLRNSEKYIYYQNCGYEAVNCPGVLIDFDNKMVEFNNLELPPDLDDHPSRKETSPLTLSETLSFSE